MVLILELNCFAHICTIGFRKTSIPSAEHDVQYARGSEDMEEWHTDLLDCFSEPKLCTFLRFLNLQFFSYSKEHYLDLRCYIAIGLCIFQVANCNARMYLIPWLLAIFE